MPKPNLPKVTCIITTCNRKDIVDRAVKSVICQTYQPIEIIVVDDASNDGTYAYLKEKYNDKMNIKIIHNIKSIGPSGARNIGIKKAEGEYIAFLDDDDEWLSNKIQMQMEEAKNGYELVTCTKAKYCVGDIISEYGTSLRAVTLKRMYMRNVIINITPLIKTKIIKNNLFDVKINCGEDYDVWIRILKSGVKTININKPLAILHRSSANSLNMIRKNKYLGRKRIFLKNKSMMSTTQKVVFILNTIVKYIIPDPRYYKKIIEHRFMTAKVYRSI